MRAFSQALSALALVLCFVTVLPLSAQTYTPKQIRIEGAGDADTAELLRIAALKPGTLTKQEIEAALQRLADTGMFTDLSYTVNPEALIFKLTAPATAQALPVHYANFVWWQPTELEQLVEARVPIFHGKLPLSGTLTDQVEAALTDILREKGISAAVTAVQSTDHPGSPVNAISLVITRPQILLGEVHLQGADPALSQPLQKLQSKLTGEDFDLSETSRSLAESIADIYQNAGYLDISTDAPTFSAPHKDLDRFTVDATTTIHSGDKYHVSQIALQPAPPLTQSELDKATGIKTGDPASTLALRIAQGELAKAYADDGYLDANATVDTGKDSAAHTVSYRFTIVPGDVYHLDRVDISALPPDLQTALTQRWHIVPGMVAGAALRTEVFRALNDLHAVNSVKFNFERERLHHTVILSLTPSKTTPTHK